MFKNRIIIDRIKAEGKVAANAIGTASYLRLEANINSTYSAISFNVNQNVGGTPNDTEVRLKQTDMFTITSVGIFIFKTTGGTQAQIAQANLYASPNPLVFTGTGEAAALNSIYNSRLTLSVDRKQFVPAFPTISCYRVATSQKGVGSSATSNNQVQNDGWEGPNYGMAEWDPELTISGAGQTDVSIILPNSVSLAGTSSTNFCAIIFKGILWQGASASAQ